MPAVVLVGLVRVSTDKQNTRRQRDALEPICRKGFEEKASGKLSTADRPTLLDAMGSVPPGGMLAVQGVDRLGRNLLEGLIVLNDLFQQGIAVKVLDGITAGEHRERSLILDIALALSEDRRRDIFAKTKDGLEAARKAGRVGGRPAVVNDDKRVAIHARRARRVDPDYRGRRRGVDRRRAQDAPGRSRRSLSGDAGRRPASLTATEPDLGHCGVPFSGRGH